MFFNFKINQIVMDNKPIRVVRADRVKYHKYVDKLTGELVVDYDKMIEPDVEEFVNLESYELSRNRFKAKKDNEYEKNQPTHNYNSYVYN